MTYYEILVNTEGTAFKFYSFEYADNGTPSGAVFWGRIGTPGRMTRYSPDEALRKREEKLGSHGYRILQRRSSQPRLTEGLITSLRTNPNETVNVVSADLSTPTTRARRRPRVQTHDEVQEDIADREVTNTPRGVPSASDVEAEIRGESPVRRASRRVSQASERAERARVGATSDSYKVNRAGLIPNYRRGYERQEPKNYKVVGRDEIQGSSRMLEKIKDFYNRIPASGVANKRPFGFDWESEQIFSRHAGQFRFLLDQRNIPMACFEITRDGKSNFLYIKTSQTDYKSVLKYVISVMGVLTTGSSNLVVTVAGTTLISAMREILPNATRTGRVKVKFTINRTDAIRFRAVQTYQRWEK